MHRVVIDHESWAVPCVRGTRIPVATILGLLTEGLTPADVLTPYAQLILEDVLACEHYVSTTANERGVPLRQL